MRRSESLSQSAPSGQRQTAGSHYFGLATIQLEPRRGEQIVGLTLRRNIWRSLRWSRSVRPGNRGDGSRNEAVSLFLHEPSAIGSGRR